MRLKRYFQVAWLPCLLTALLVVETYLFNRWLNIIPQLYFVRRTAASVGLGALIFGPAVFFKKKNSRYAYLFTASVLVALIFISEYIYYEYSGGFLQASALGYAGQTGELGDTIKTLFTPKLILFITPLLLTVAAYFTWNSSQKAAMIFAKEKIVAFFLLLVIFVGGYGILIKLEIHDWGDATRLYSQIYDLATLVGKEGVVNYYLEDLVKLAFSAHQVSEGEKTFVVNWAKSRPAQDPPAQNFGEMKGRNLFFLQIESLENWVIGYKINGQEVAPNLDALAAQGMYFPNYYSQIGPGNTADAEFSILNSLYPLPDAVAFITQAKNQYFALPQLLDNSGYSTAVMHGDVSTFWNRSNAYPSMGYEQQFSQKDYTIPRPVGFDNLGDDDFFQQSLPKLQTLKQPFMATLITLSTHTPFVLPADLNTLNIPANSGLTPTQQLYLQSVHYSDMALGKFLAGLKAEGLYNNSLIAIYGDHNAFIGTPDSQTNHVPLILLAPGSNVQGVNNTPGSHLDLFPTIAGLLGLKVPATALGQNLFNTAAPVVTQRVLGTGAIKFIITPSLKYNGSADGVFAHGSCLRLPAGSVLPVGDCQQLYQQQLDTIESSDIAVRYNLVQLLSP